MASNRNGPVALRKPISTDFAVSIVRFGLPISKVAVASCAPRENSSAGFGARSTYCAVMLPTRSPGRFWINPTLPLVDELTRRVIGRIRLELPWRPGARELLADLRNAGVRCALVTMSEGPLAAEILAALPDGSFKFMVTGDQVEHGKPHPEPYLRAIEQLRETDPGLAAAHCLALEDSVPGVTSALAAGLLTVGIRGFQPTGWIGSIIGAIVVLVIYNKVTGRKSRQD